MISPRDVNYRLNLANLYLANRQPDQAIAVLQSLQAVDTPELRPRVAAMLAQAQQFRQDVASRSVRARFGNDAAASGRFGNAAAPASYQRNFSGFTG